MAKERNEVGWEFWMEVRRAAADREEWSRSEEALCENFPNRRNVLKHSPDFVLRKKFTKEQLSSTLVPEVSEVYFFFLSHLIEK